MKVVALGVHVLDTLVYPVAEIPDGQGGALVDQIRVTAAGTAGGTALVLAKLGAEVAVAGAIGTDATGELLVSLLARDGVDTAHLVRRNDVATSASVLPIRTDGSRPAFHVVGANATYQLADVPWDAIAAADHLHLGAPEFLGTEQTVQIASFARAHDTATSADFLAPGIPAMFEVIAPMLGHLDQVLPNDEQICGWTGATTLDAACGDLLRRGAGCVAATAGGEGAIVASGDEVTRVPTSAVEVVDTTGCGDAFSAGFIVGLGAGGSPEQAAAFGCVVASRVAEGLGTDHGDFADLTPGAA